MSLENAYHCEDHARSLQIRNENYIKIKENVTQEYLDILDNDELQEGQKMIAFFELLLRLRQVFTPNCN